MYFLENVFKCLPVCPPVLQPVCLPSRLPARIGCEVRMEFVTVPIRVVTFLFRKCNNAALIILETLTSTYKISQEATFHYEGLFYFKF